MPAPSPAAAQGGWQAIDEVLADLDRLIATNLADDAFFPALFDRLVSLGCLAAALWNVPSSSSPRVSWHASQQSGENGHDITAEANQAAVEAAVRAGEPTQSASGGPSIIVPWKRVAGASSALQVWLPATVRTDAAKGYVRLIAAVAEVVAKHIGWQEQQRLSHHAEQQSRLDAFNLSLHASLDLDQTAFRIANDGRLLIGCDRVAVAIRRGRHYRVIAVSGAEHIHRRSESVHQLELLIDRVATSGQPLWQDGQTTDLPPQLATALAGYLDLSPALALAVIPLTAPPAEKTIASQPLTAIVLEQYAQPFDAGSRERIEAILPHCRQALTNNLRVRGIPAHRFWLSLGREGWLPTWISRTTLALGLLAAIIAALVLIPADVWIKTRGELQPVVRNEVFAPRDGVVTEVFIEHGQHVQAGDKLLEMRSPELDLELQRVQGELETNRKRLAAAQSERLQMKTGDADARLRQRRLTAEEEQLQQQVAALEHRQTMLKQQLAELTVKSPVGGDVITWNVQQQLAARPLRRGDALLTIADTAGDWQLELRVPSRRAGRLLASRQDAAQDNTANPSDVSFRLTTDPGRALQGSIKHIAERVEIDESGESYLLVTVACPREQIPNRVPGATAIASLRCSRATLGEALFHDLFDAAQLWLPF